MDDYEEIVNSVRGVPKPPVATGLPKVEEEPEDYDAIIKSVRSPVVQQPNTVTNAPLNPVNIMADPDEVPGFTGYKAHPMVSKIAMEYYGKADPKEALNSWVNDQTWNNANAAMALIDAVKAQTADPIKAKQMAFLGEEFDKLPAFWEGDRPLTEKASRLWANVWRGVADPLTWAGGALGGKVASKLIGEGAKGILARAGGAGAVDVAAGATAETSQELLKVSTGRKEEVDPLQIAEGAALSGITGGAIRGTAGILGRAFKKPETPPVEAIPTVANDNPLDYEQARINARVQLESQDQALGILSRVQDNATKDYVPPELANQNKFPEMERTTPVKDEVDSGVLKRIDNDDEPTLFKDLEHLDNSLDEPYVVPMKDKGYLDESEPKFGKDMPVIIKEEPPVQNNTFDNLGKIEDSEPISEPLHIKHKNALEKIEPPKQESILERPKLKEIPKDIKEPSPLFVEVLDKITGKAHGLTYLNHEMDSWAEIIRASNKDKGYEDVRPKVTKKQVAAEVEQMGLNVPEVFDNLSKMTGITDGPRLHQVMYAGIMESKKEALNTHTLASNFNEALLKFGRGSKEANEAMIAYAQMRQYFQANMKAFAGSRSEVGRALSMLRPDENIEQQINRLAKELNDTPEGLKSTDGNILCG